MSTTEGDRLFNESCIQDPAGGIENAVREEVLSIVGTRHDESNKEELLDGYATLGLNGEGSDSLAASSFGSRSEGAPLDRNEASIGPRLQNTKTRFMSPTLKHQRRKVLGQFLLTNFMLASLILSILSIYWGATYRESHYMYKVNVLAVIQDESVEVNPSLVQTLPTLIDGLPCSWHIYNGSEYQRNRNISASDIDKEVLLQVYHEDYWMALNVKTNATNSLQRSLVNQSAEPFNFSTYFQVIYEGGRDPISMRSTILPNMQRLEELYKRYIVTEYLPNILSNLGVAVVQRNLIGASDVNFGYLDYRPFYNAAILSPLQVGLIYCLILTFFQLGIYGPLHKEMAQILKPKSMIIYRICVSFCTYFIMSLFFCTLSAMFQIDFTAAFGRGGFVIYWMTTWLLMAALGGANENVSSVIIATVGPQYLGFWLMTWIIINISPSFYPMAIHSSFYRYGYMMPIQNALGIFRVIFLNTSKHTMGRNYGIICAWIVLNTSLFPIVMIFVGKRMERKSKASAAAQTQQTEK